MELGFRGGRRRNEDRGRRCKPESIGHRLPETAVQEARMSSASKPIHGVIQPSKSNPEVFLTSSGSCRRDLAQEELESKEKSGPECTASRRTESCRPNCSRKSSSLSPGNSKIKSGFSKLNSTQKGGEFRFKTCRNQAFKLKRRSDPAPISRRLCCSIQQAFPTQQYLRKII